MDNSLVRNILNSILDENLIYENEQMGKHTSFKTGGSAAFLVTPENEEQISALIKALGDIPYMVVGNGSNLLFVKDYEGVVIELKSKFAHIEVDGEYIIAQSGALLSKIANIALEKGLGGFEFASGIPGTIGGAVAMNAGAYGGEMNDVVVSTLCIDENGDMSEITDHKYSYRHSVFTDSTFIALKTKIKLFPKEKELIKTEMLELNRRRKEKQPLEYPSAGSTFKRPEGYFAGKLIEDAGLKGFKIGGAMVSEKHAGFVINYDNASAEDIVRLMEHVQKEVYTRFGVTLEPEVKLIGKE